MKNLRIALIGAGYLGTIHAQKIAHVEGAQLVAVVDLDAQKGKNSDRKAWGGAGLSRLF